VHLARKVEHRRIPHLRLACKAELVQRNWARVVVRGNRHVSRTAQCGQFRPPGRVAAGHEANPGIPALWIADDPVQLRVKGS